MSWLRARPSTHWVRMGVDRGQTNHFCLDARIRLEDVVFRGTLLQHRRDQMYWDRSAQLIPFEGAA